MSDTKSVVLVGVGGQGILLASEIVAQTAMHAGYQVKTNEVHGMAQRGGSVIAQIRYGKEVHSPLVAMGTARVLCSLEQIEALRYVDYLAEDGLCVSSNQQVIPVTVSMGAAKYPEDAHDRLKRSFNNLKYIKAGDIAAELGNIKAANVVLLGALSRGLDLPKDAWQAAIKSCVPERFLELNIAAFKRGQEL